MGVRFAKECPIYLKLDNLNRKKESEQNGDEGNNKSNLGKVN